MKIKTIKTETIINILEYIFSLFIILESNTIYSQLYGSHVLLRTSMVGIVIVCSLMLFYFRKFKFSKRFFFFAGYCWVVSLLMFINTKSINGIGIIILILSILFPLLFLFVENYGKEGILSITKKFVNIVIVLCVISLFFWFFSSVFNIIKPTGVVKAIWAKPYSTFNTYFYLHFDTQSIYWLFPEPIIRNTGIFAEGPMYGLIIVIALMFNVLINKSKKEYLYTFILCVTLLTTFSVTGYVSAIIILGSYFFRIIKKIDFKKFDFKKKIMYIILLILSLLILVPMFYNLLDKKLDTGSANHRGKDIVNGFNVFFKHPLIGQGIIHEREYEENPDIGYGYSNAIIPVATDGGLVLLVLYIIFPLLLTFEAIKKKNLDCILFAIVFVILLFTTLFQYRMTMVLLLVIQSVICKESLANKSQKKKRVDING